MKKRTVYKPIAQKFHEERDRLRAHLRKQRTQDLQKAFPECVEPNGTPMARGKLIRTVLCQFTKEHYVNLATVERKAEEEAEAIEKQIETFENA